ncbi:MAG: DUF6580 family putative transport protein [Phycisphaerae bacterium]
MNRNVWTELAVWSVLVVGCVLARLADHAANVAPVAAVALFAGFWFGRRLLAVLCPLAAMVASDAIIGGYNWGTMTVVYAAMMFPLAWRTVLRHKITPIRVGLCAASGSVVFFLSTNLAVWFFGTLYAKTAAGLAACFVSALPFFRNKMLGDLAFAAVLFGGYAVLSHWRSSRVVKLHAAKSGLITD